MAFPPPSHAFSDYLVGAGEHDWWHFEAESPSRLQVDDELEFG